MKWSRVLTIGWAVLVLVGCDAATESPAPDPDVDAPAFLRKGLVVPEASIPCVTDEGEPSDACNHHGSNVLVTEDGTVFVTWYHGKGEKSLDSRVLWARWPRGADDFEPWAVLYDDPGRAEGNPVLWQSDRTGHLHLFFVTLFGPTWNDGQVRMKTSADMGATWSDVKILREELNWMVRNKPIRLADGNLLLPCYDERLYMPTFMLSDDDFDESVVHVDMMGAGVRLVGFIGKIQPSVVQRADGTIVAWMRQETTNAPSLAWEITSADGGYTWDDPVQLPVPNRGHSMEMIELKSGRWALVFNNSQERRFPVTVALSLDEGRTFDFVADIQAECDAAGCSYGYPSIAQDPLDDSIWVSYTHNRQTIGWAHFNERWIEENHVGFAIPSE